MIFDKIANVVTKHHRLVILVWIVALLVSVPAMLQVGSVVNYNSDFGGVTNYESVKAQEIIDQQFSTSVANGSLIVLLQADDVTDPQVRDFVLQLQNNIENNSDIKYLQGTTSVYSYAEMVFEQATMQMGPAMWSTEQSVNSTAMLLWGIPAGYLGVWSQTQNDTIAYNTMSATLNDYLTQSHADANISQFALGYFNTFYYNWTTTVDTNLPPAERATAAVIQAGNNITESMPAGQMKQMVQAVLASFNLNTFNNQAAIHQFTLGMFSTMSGITNKTFLQDVYDLGPVYNAYVVQPYAESLVRNGTLSTYPIAVPEELTSNFISSNNKTMLFMITFTKATDFTEENGDKPLLTDVGLIRSEISKLKASTGTDVTTYVTGGAAINADMQASSEGDMKLIEPITIIIIIVLMGILFRSVVAQFLPLGAVGVAIGISQALVFVIGSTIAQIDSTVTTMLFAVLMGVGTDYSIFIITRYREERIRGADREQAVHTSIAWAGESIATSGATVVIAFFAMALASFSFVQTMGLLLGLSIVVALLVALTLIPAVLMVVGNRVFWPNTGKRFANFSKKLMEKKAEGNHGYFHRAATFSVKNAKVVILAAILISIPTTYIYATQETSFDFIGSMGEPESIQGMQAMAADFGAGGIMPTQVVITSDEVIYNGSFDPAYLAAIENITATIAADSMVQKVTSPSQPNGQQVSTMVGKDNKSVLITVVLKEEPQAASAVSYIADLRGELADVKAQQPALASSTILVGGTTASMYDVGKDTSQQFANIEVLVIIGIFIVLMIVLGSLLLPAFAVVSIAMSISWAFAATSLVFGAWLGKPILWIIPLILFVMLMGIGMDYNVFILTRIREEVHKGKEIKRAVVDAVDWTGGIITALALIMAGAFGSIMLSSNTMLQEFGFALFLAVLLDAMVVRTYIVPAAIVLMGKWAWWAPGRLQREGRKEKMEAKKAETEDAPGK